MQERLEKLHKEEEERRIELKKKKQNIDRLLNTDLAKVVLEIIERMGPMNLRQLVIEIRKMNYELWPRKEERRINPQLVKDLNDVIVALLLLDGNTNKVYIDPLVAVVREEQELSDMSEGEEEEYMEDGYMEMGGQRQNPHKQRLRK